MTRYLISFDDRAMTFPEEDLPDVTKARCGNSCPTRPISRS
jgi:hypothetical protein